MRLAGRVWRRHKGPAGLSSHEDARQYVSGAPVRIVDVLHLRGHVVTLRTYADGSFTRTTWLAI